MSQEHAQNQRYLSLQQVLQAIDEEPEYPDIPPPTQLISLIRQAVNDKDEDHILHMMRQTVRLTKECISKRMCDLANFTIN